MTTLITGAGLVGTAFAARAAKRGEAVVFLDPAPRGDYIRRRLGEAKVALVQDDVRNLPGLITAIREHRCETVLHTASLIGQKVASPMHNGYAINVGGAMNVAEAVRLTGVKRVVHISTFGAYDWRRISTGPVNEEAPLGAGSAYSNSKVAQEMILEAYSKQFGFELMVIRPANVFGEGHFSAGSGGGQKVQDLVLAGMRGERARIPEEQTMDFVYLYEKDIGRAIDLAATVPLPEKTVFNVGYDFVTRFDDLVATVKKVLPRLEVDIVPGKKPESRSVPLDVSRAGQYLGWTPEFDMETAFADYARALGAN